MDSSTPNKKKRGRPPSKQEAEIALDIIKAAEKEKNESEESIAAAKESERIALEEIEKQNRLAELERLQIEEVQQKIKRKLRENLEKKEEQDRLKANKAFLEKSLGNIKWKSINSGYKLQGYIEDNLVFEIERKQITFNLYIKDKSLLNKKCALGYAGCSTNLEKLKEKSEKFL